MRNYMLIGTQEKLTMNAKTKRVFLIVKIAISITLLSYIFKKIPAQDIFHSLKEASLSYVIFGLLMTPVVGILAAMQFKILTKIQGMTLGVMQIYKINLISQFYSFLMPGYLAGGAVKWIKMQQYEKKGVESFISIILNRFLEFSILVLIGCITMLGFCRSYGYGGYSYILLLIIGGVVLCYSVLFIPAITDFFEGIFVIQHWIPHFVKDKIHKLVIAFNRFHDLTVGDYYAIAVNNIVRHMAGVCSIYLLSLSVHIHLSIIDIVWIRSIVILISALPIAFAGIGVREGTLIFFMQQFNIEPATAVSFSFLFLLKTIITACAGGGLELYDNFLRKEKKT